jgi:hypothetical protein
MKGSFLLILTAIVETTVGLALLVMPNYIIRALLGAELSAPFEVTIARIAGAAILVLGIVSWKNRALPFQQIRPLISSLLIYNAIVTIILIQSGIDTKLTPFLAIAVLAHALLGTICAANINARKENA